MFFKLALRIFKKFLLTKIASVLILSVGTLFFIIASTIYIKDFQFNSKLENAERIFRINTHLQFNSGNVQEMSLSPALVGPHLKDALSDVQDQTRIWKLSSNTLKIDDESYFDEDIVSVDPSFFDVFVFSANRGSLTEMKRARPDVAVLSTEGALKLFGQSNPIGKLITINDKDYTIAGVINESETDLDHSIFIPISSDIFEFEWIETFVLFNKTTQIENVTSLINASLEDPMAGEYNSDVMKISFHPMSLSEMRFQDALFTNVKSNKLFLYFLMAIAIVLMALCCLSVLNFEGTISLNRIKEVSIRKMFGSSRFQIFYQFVIENSVVFLFSLPIVLLSFYFLLPFINSAWNYKLSMEDLTNPHTIFFILFFLVTYIVLMTVINYRLYLMDGVIQKGSHQQKPTFNGITRFLLPFQIFICVLVLCFTSLSTRQVRQMSDSEVGFVYKGVYIIDIAGVNTENISLFLKERLLTESGISYVAQVSKHSIPGRDAEVQLFNLNGSDADKEIACEHLFIDEDYFKLLDIKILANKKLFRSGDVIINSSLREKHSIRIDEENSLNGLIIAAEVADYYHDGLFSTTKPMVFQFDESKFDALLIKVLPTVNLKLLEKAINNFIHSEELGVQVSLSPLMDIYFSKQNSDYHLLEIITLCNYFIILITLFGILSSTNMIYNLLVKQNVIRKIHGANNFQILTHSGRLIYIETLIAFILSVSLSHLIFFEWRSRYAVKAPLWVGSYIPLLLFLIISILVFIFFFLIRIRKIKFMDAL